MYSRRPVYLAALVVGVGAAAFARWFPRDAILRIPCMFKNLAGIPCPFCGTTRAFLSAGEGSWAHAWHESPLGALLLPGSILLAAWAAWRLWRSRYEPPPLTPFKFPRWILIGALLAVAANWMYRLAAGLQ